MPTLESEAASSAAPLSPYQLAERLKAEAERQLFIVPGRSMPIAHEIERLGALADAPALRALGVMTAADALREQGRYREALSEYNRAGQLYLSVGDDVGWARTRLGAAYARASTVQLGPALEEAERARSILRAHGSWVRLARLESAMGNLLRELGRNLEALQASARALEAANQVEDVRERELVAAELWINQATVYQRLDQYETAEQLLMRAAETFSRHSRPGPVAVARGNLARGLAAQGHVSRALAQALEVRRTTLDLGRASAAAIFGQVAVECLMELNRPGEAGDLADENVEQLRACEAGVELAKSLLQRAMARGRLARFSEAAEDLAGAEALFRSGGCEGWAAIVRLQHAQILERGGSAERALSAAVEAGRELRQRGLVVQSARADLVRARSLAKLANPEAAVRVARCARIVGRRAGVPLLEYEAARLIGELSADERSALRAFGHAATALEKSQGRILTEQRAGFLQLEDKLSVYTSAIRLSVKAGEARRAFHFAERAKTRALVDALALRARGVIPRSGPATQRLTNQLAALRHRYDRLSSTVFDPQPLDELGASSVGGHPAVLQSELEQCEARIAAVLDELRLTQASSVDQLADLQGKVRMPVRYLGTDTALVQYAIVGDEIVIFVLRRGHPIEVRSAPAGATLQVSRLLRMFELNLRTTVMRGRCNAELEHQARLLLERLHAVLVQPVLELIGACRRLVLVPHGILHSVPFAALYDGANYLVQRFELAVAPSASAIALWRARRVRSASQQVLVVAHSADGYLPGALAEGESIASLFGAKRLFESAATLQNLRDNLDGATLVHVAAHGHSRKDSPLFSHLRLADGRLTALDCLDLPFNCELVTLSACETGHAVVAAGDEPIGLTRSLLHAGARAVIQSLWRVDDEATRYLMTELYQRLRNGAGRAEALRAAQLVCAEQHPHPAYWAAFGLVGDWRPIQ